MSYDIALYRRDFLKKAIEEKRGDWTGADPISEDVIRAFVAKAEAGVCSRVPPMRHLLSSPSRTESLPLWS